MNKVIPLLIQNLDMQLFSVKPKMQILQENLKMSASDQSQPGTGAQKYRLKPKQFQKEDMNLFDILAQDAPYRIPGTKIGVLTDKTINANHQKDSDLTESLLVAV